MKFLIDSREQAPFAFDGYEVWLETAALPCGDYSLPGFTDKAAVERKSLDDLIGCLMGKERERFEKELAKAKHYELFGVVVEGTLADVCQGKYRSAMRPHSALQSIIAWQVRYRVPFLFAGSRKMAEYWVYCTLAKYLREIEERFKTATKAQEKAA